MNGLSEGRYIKGVSNVKAIDFIYFTFAGCFNPLASLSSNHYVDLNKP